MGSPSSDTAQQPPRPRLLDRFRELALAQLRQGATPSKLALTAAVAVTLALFGIFAKRRPATTVQENA